MSLDKLTPTQEKALRYIEYAVKNDGLAPTLRELCDYMGYSAVGSAQDLVRALKRKGYLKTLGRRAARSLIPVSFLSGETRSEVPLPPGSLGSYQDTPRSQGSPNSPNSVVSMARYAGSRKGLDFGHSAMSHFGPSQPLNDSAPEARDQTYLLPILGQVPAGLPMDQTENHLGHFPIPKSLLAQPAPNSEELFVVKAMGDSMIGAGILDGDWLVVQKNKHPEHGTIVVARVDGAVTVKRLVNDRKLSWCLQPENPHFQTLIGQEQPFELVGKVVALQRAIH